MPTGLNNSLTANEVNMRAGRVAKALHEAFEDVTLMQDFFQTWNDSELAGYGLSQTDIDLLRAAFNDLDLLRQIYRGQQPLAVPQNFRSNARKIWGFGFDR